MSTVLERSEQDESFASVRKLDSYHRDRQLQSVDGGIGPSFRRKTKGIHANEIVLNEYASPEFEAVKRPPERNPPIRGQGPKRRPEVFVSRSKTGTRYGCEVDPGFAIHES